MIRFRLKKILKAAKRLVCGVMIGMMLALHNTYKKEMTSTEEQRQEIQEDREA